MPAATPLPTPFGRFTAVVSEHQHLGVALRRLDEMCRAVEAGQLDLAPELQPVPLIGELQSELSQHFAGEEGDTHFGAIASECPSLLRRIADLKAQHVVMLEELTSLAENARDKAKLTALPAPARRLIEELRTHEHAETMLLQEFLLRDEGAGED